MNLRRRFVNLVAENCMSSVCSLHRLDVSQHLFYPSTAEAEAAKPTIYRLSLPSPTYNFQPAVVGRNVEQHLFGLANPRISESRILWRSQEGNTFLYDADSHTAWSMPNGLRYKGKRPIVISAPVPDADSAPGEEEDLFVMCSNSGYPASRCSDSTTPSQNLSTQELSPMPIHHGNGTAFHLRRCPRAPPSTLHPRGARRRPCHLRVGLPLRRHLPVRHGEA